MKQIEEKMEGRGDGGTGVGGYYLWQVKIKFYNAMSHEEIFLDQTVKSDIITYESIKKSSTVQGDV